MQMGGHSFYTKPHNFTRIRGHLSYSLSPYAQKPFAKMLSVPYNMQRFQVSRRRGETKRNEKKKKEIIFFAHGKSAAKAGRQPVGAGPAVCDAAADVLGHQEAGRPPGQKGVVLRVKAKEF